MANSLVCSILLLALFSNVQSQDECLYKCTSEREFELGGQTFPCTGALKCNLFDADNNCKPCLAANQICKKNFTCITGSPNEVAFEAVRVPCPNKHICNTNGEDNCVPCVHVGCEGSAYFTCDKRYPLKVTVMGMPATCQRGLVCNADYEPPCDPCIKKK